MFFMTCLRPPFYEEAEILTVLKVSFRVGSPYYV